MDYWVNFCDCLDKKRGLPSLETKSIDLCLTDFPYNVNIGTSGPRINSMKKGTNNDFYYEDNLDPREYLDFCVKIFYELKRICKKLVFTPGDKNKKMWYQEIEAPIDEFMHYKTNGRSPGLMSRVRTKETIFLYGNWEKKQVFPRDVYSIPIKNKDPRINHPCPKPLSLWLAILEDYMNPVGIKKEEGFLNKPNAVLDPFLGSGTTLEACIILDIDFLGYEREKEYINNIRYKIQRGKLERKKYVFKQKMKKFKQQTLEFD